MLISRSRLGIYVVDAGDHFGTRALKDRPRFALAVDQVPETCAIRGRRRFLIHEVRIYGRKVLDRHY
jgi:hypothetical protein